MGHNWIDTGRSSLLNERLSELEAARFVDNNCNPQLSQEQQHIVKEMIRRFRDEAIRQIDAGIDPNPWQPDSDTEISSNASSPSRSFSKS